MASFSSKWVVRSEFHYIYIQYFSYKYFSLKVKTTKLSLESCCPAGNFSSERLLHGDQPVYLICAGPTNFCSFQLV